MKIISSLKECLLLFICFALSKNTHGNGCTGSYFTMEYSPYCGCWQVCGNFISDCDQLVSLSWDFGDGSPPYSSLTDPPCHAFTQPGTYTVTMRVEGYCHNIFATTVCNIPRTIVVAPDTSQFEVSADFSYSFSCYRSQVFFTHTAQLPPGITNYFWDFGDGTFSNAYAPAHVFPGCGSYPVKLIFSSSASIGTCCNNTVSDTVTQVVNIDCGTNPNLFAASVSLSSPLTCLGNNASLAASASGGIPPYSFQWSTGSTAASITGLSHGIYHLTAADNAGCFYTLSYFISPKRCIPVSHPPILNLPFPIPAWWH